jgi:hypothetical protein
MRRHEQLSLNQPRIAHPHARELEAVTQLAGFLHTSSAGGARFAAYRRIDGRLQMGVTPTRQARYMRPSDHWQRRVTFPNTSVQRKGGRIGE